LPFKRNLQRYTTAPVLRFPPFGFDPLLGSGGVSPRAPIGSVEEEEEAAAAAAVTADDDALLHELLLPGGAVQVGSSRRPIQKTHPTLNPKP
jgi:hypothetical protein